MLSKIVCYNIRGSTAADNTCVLFILVLKSIIQMSFERQEQQIGKSEENSKILWNINLKKESIENTCITKHIYTGICAREMLYLFGGCACILAI